MQRDSRQESLAGPNYSVERQIYRISLWLEVGIQYRALLTCFLKVEFF